MRIRLLIYLFFSFIAFSGYASAEGFGVSPSSLELSVQRGSEASRQLLVYNSGEEDANFSAISSNRESVAISPESGTIAGGGTARLTVTALGKMAGVSQEQITVSIMSRGNKGEVALSLGTIVSVKLNTFELELRSANVFVGVFMSASIVFAGLAAYYSLRKKPERLSSDFISAYEIYMTKK